MQRRLFLASATMGSLAGCSGPPPELAGGFTGSDLAYGHSLRAQLATGARPTPTRTRRTHTIIAGGGIAGLAAARALRLRGIDDIALLEQAEQAGGNSRGGSVGGIACPLGAHYLPVPGGAATQVQDLLEELGLRQRVAGRWQYDERHLCHSPQERLFFNGQWQEGLLPLHDVGPATLAQYRQFAQAVQSVAAQSRFQLPTPASQQRTPQPLDARQQSLDAQTFAHWLAQQGLHDPHLRWYLDYCCRDDYGAGSARVSAWAGLHYFASRHGFQAPGQAEDSERDGVLTWPEGNGWLSQRLAAPLQAAGQLHCQRSVLHIEEERHGVSVDVLDHASGSVERWLAAHCIVALPVFVAARVVGNPPGFLQAAAQRLHSAPWLVANIHLQAPLQDRPGAAPAWDNVLYGQQDGSLGYVDASHQRLDPRPAPTVLTYYQALGDWADGRQRLLQQPWTHWRDAILSHLTPIHPDLPKLATRIEMRRYGHAMAIPTPGLQTFLRQLGQPRTARLSFAHADWSGYSVFEEAFTRGHWAGQWR